jgi:hypothetical protein
MIVREGMWQKAGEICLMTIINICTLHALSGAKNTLLACPILSVAFAQQWDQKPYYGNPLLRNSGFWGLPLLLKNGTSHHINVITIYAHCWKTVFHNSGLRSTQNWPGTTLVQEWSKKLQCPWLASATRTFVTRSEEHLWNISVLQREHI